MKHFNLTLSFLSLLALSACSTTSVQTRYYTLAADAQAKSSTATEFSLVVKKFSADPAYAHSNIVYRESPYDFMSYNNDLWATSPEYQITNVVAENIKQSGLFQKVEVRASAIPDYELSGFVSAIEEVDLDSSDRYARVALELTFRDVQKDSVLWKKSYDEKEALAGNEPREIAKAASKLVNRYTQEAIDAMSSAIAR